MVDAVGLAFGVPGLIVACAQIYQLTTVGRHFDEDGSIIVSRVSVEQVKFQAWLEKAGFLDNADVTLRLRPLMQEVLKDTLQGIQTTLIALKNILDKYELGSSGKASGISVALPAKFWELESKIAKDQSFQPFKFFSSVKRSVVWAVVDLQRAKSYVTDLRDFNEDLRSISGELRDAQFSALPSQVLPFALDESNLERLVIATAEDEPELSLCASIKKEVLAIARRSDLKPDPKLGFRKNKLYISNLQPLEAQNRWLAKYVDQSGRNEWVIVEDKSYAYSADPKVAQFAEKRIEDICYLITKTKPDRFRVPACLGYSVFRERKCFSFIYQIPAGVDPQRKPLSLEYILSGNVAGAQKPSLGDRFQLARALVDSMLLLQACGILHKAFNSKNILFFVPVGSDSYDLMNPYIMGFDYARLHGKNFISETFQASVSKQKLHSHPNYEFGTGSQRFLKVFDIYSLGIVLLEIGLWSPINEIVSELVSSEVDLIRRLLKQTEVDLTNINKSLSDAVRSFQGALSAEEARSSALDISPSAAQNALIVNLPKKYPEIGAVYGNVVLRCLTGDIGNSGAPDKALDCQQDEEEPEHVLQEMFVKNIVDELAKCNG